ELKEIEVEVIDPRQTHAYELIGQVFDLLQTDHLPVKFPASRSRHAAQDHHERFAAPPRFGLARFQAGEPAILSGLDLLTAPRPAALCLDDIVPEIMRPLARKGSKR